MHHSQNANGLVCGLSTRKIVTPCSIQKRKTSRSASHSAAPVVGSRSRTGRCPGTSSAGSRRTGSCRRGGAGTTPGARVTHGWSGEAWKAMSSATSMPCSSRRRDQRVEVVERAELGVDGGVAALGAADRPRAARVVRRALDGRLFGPLRNCAADRVDRRQVEDVEAHLGDVRQPRDRRRANVPWRSGSGDAERGNSSYQAENAARSGSTTSSCSGATVANRRSGYAPGRAPRASASSALVRAPRRHRAPAATRPRRPIDRRRRRRPSRVARPAAVSISSAPISRSTVTSCPASIRSGEVAPPRREPVDPGLDRVPVAARAGRP